MPSVCVAFVHRTPSGPHWNHVGKLDGGRDQLRILRQAPSAQPANTVSGYQWYCLNIVLGPQFLKILNVSIPQCPLIADPIEPDTHIRNCRICLARQIHTSSRYLARLVVFTLVVLQLTAPGDSRSPATVHYTVIATPATAHRQRRARHPRSPAAGFTSRVTRRSEVARSSGFLALLPPRRPCK